MFGPFPIDAVIARAAHVEGVRIIGNAADLEAAVQTPPRNAPALFVLCDEQGNRSLGGTGQLIQNMTAIVKLVMWVRNAGSAAQISAEMIAFEKAARRVFFGWRPDPEFTPMEIRASGADQGHGAFLIRQLLMTSGYRQTTQTTP